MQKKKKNQTTTQNNLFTHNITLFLPIIFTFWDLKTHTSCKEKKGKWYTIYTLEKHCEEAIVLYLKSP